MKLGFVGVGLMGRPMVLRLLAAGHEVAVWNRSREKLAPVVEQGAQPALSPADVAGRSEIVMMCVTDQRAAEQVIFGADGIAHADVKGKVLVDFSSIAPAKAREFAQRLGERGMGLVDAPVSGGVPGAEKGTLAIMAGGREEDVERARPVVLQLAQRFTRMGEAGAGQVTKLCNQVIVGSLFPVIAEAVRLAESAGVDAARLPEALKGGFADSLPLQVFGPRMASRNYDPPLGTNDVMLKDLENAATVAKECGVPLPMAHMAAELYRLMAARGKGGMEPSALVDFLSGKS